MAFDSTGPVLPVHAVTTPPITLRNVRKRYDRFPALDGVSLEVRPGELLALLGPSGSGKTTLLRAIAGLEFPDEGQILFGDKDVTHAGAAERRVGFVFQQYALFRHMTVARNIAFGLDVRRRRDRPSREATTARVQELLRLVELGGLGERYPAQLSGGQRQRVALARALAVEPRVLLLDEPFGALDATVRKSLRRELRRVHDAAGVTTLFVTHDQEEALELADRVAVLDKGVLHQVGTPSEVLDRPATAFVAGFVGDAVCFEGAVAGGVFRAGALTAPAPGAADGPSLAYIRPHAFQAGEQGAAARVIRTIARGPLTVAEVELLEDGRRFEWWSTAQTARPAQGDTVHLAVTQAQVFGRG